MKISGIGTLIHSCSFPPSLVWRKVHPRWIRPRTQGSPSLFSQLLVESNGILLEETGCWYSSPWRSEATVLPSLQSSFKSQAWASLRRNLSLSLSSAPETRLRKTHLKTENSGALLKGTDFIWTWSSSSLRAHSETLKVVMKSN